MENQPPFVEELLDRISYKVTIAEFETAISQFWRIQNSTRKYLREIWFRSGPCKKLMDEVMPVAEFLKWQNIRHGYLRFPLNDKTPDCWLWASGAKAPRAIEVTVAQGRARFHLTREMVDNGSGRGFIELQDYAGKEEFERAFAGPSSGYTTTDALRAVQKAIEYSLRRKDHKKYETMLLLIHAPINTMILPRPRWNAIKADLVAVARESPFREVYVIGDGDTDRICFQIR